MDRNSQQPCKESPRVCLTHQNCQYTVVSNGSVERHFNFWSGKITEIIDIDKHLSSTNENITLSSGDQQTKSPVSENPWASQSPAFSPRLPIRRSRTQQKRTQRFHVPASASKTFHHLENDTNSYDRTLKPSEALPSPDHANNTPSHTSSSTSTVHLTEVDQEKQTMSKASLKKVEKTVKTASFSSTPSSANTVKGYIKDTKKHASVFKKTLDILDEKEYDDCGVDLLKSQPVSDKATVVTDNKWAASLSRRPNESFKEYADRLTSMKSTYKRSDATEDKSDAVNDPDDYVMI